jgi:O-antigen/teichoic acid export membrane protein
MRRFVSIHYLAGLSRLMVQYLPPLLVLRVLGAEANAYFFIAWTTAITLSGGAEAFSASLTVEGSHRLESLGVYTRQLIRQAVLIFGGVIVVLFIGAPLLLRVFGPEYAAEGTALLRLLLVGVAASVPVSIYLAALRARGQGVRILAIEASIAVIALGLGSLGLDRFGTTSFGVAYLLGNAVVAAAVIPKLRGLVSDATRTEPEVLP